MIENESLLDRQVNPDPPKDNRRKMRVAFLAIIFLGLGALIGNGLYRYYSAINSVDQYNKEYNARIEAERVAAAQAQTASSTTTSSVQNAN